MLFSKVWLLSFIISIPQQQNFTAKQIQYELIFSSVKLEVEVFKKTESIIKYLQSMEVMWKDNKENVEKKKIREFEKDAMTSLMFS